MGTAGEIKEIKKHIDVINSEMGDVKTSVAVLSTDMSWVKKKLNCVDDKMGDMRRSVDKKMWAMILSVLTLAGAVFVKIMVG